MASMYDVIMDLPLFKGIGHEHVSSFLEKTNIEFKKYQPEEIIHSEGTECRSLTFIISGNVRLKRKIQDCDLYVSQLVGRETVLGVLNLFGMERCYSDTATASTEVSVMRFRKEQYLTLLQKDQIYLLNYLNLLSLKAQRGVNLANNIKRRSLTELLKDLIINLCDKDSTDITIHASPERLSEVTGMEPETVWKEITELMKSGVAEVTERILKINSRQEYLEFVAK